MTRFLDRLRHWFSVTFMHALGAHHPEPGGLPPAVGVQPYTGSIRGRHR
jgi:hypothetical protein